jgi:hypothetical protein
MTKFVEVPTHSLNPPALDWAVAKAIGKVDSGEVLFVCVVRGDAFPIIAKGPERPSLMATPRYAPSTNWAHGGPLLAALLDTGKWEVVQGRHLGEVILQNYTNECNPVDSVSWCDESWRLSGSPLVATCRAIVAARLGQFVSVPTELLEVA